MPPDEPRYSSGTGLTPDQARYNVDIFSESIAEARANGRRVLPHWLSALKRAQEYLGSLPASERSSDYLPSSDERPGRTAERSSTGIPATRKPPWYLPNSEESSHPSRSDTSGPAREAPALRETGSGFRMVLAGSVCTAIEQEVLSAIWECDSREIETGGYLYALYRPDEDRVLVTHASGPGHNGRHGSGRVRLSDPRNVESGFSDVLKRAGLVRVGDWHSHPSDDPIPSDADLRIWGRSSDEDGVLPYSGVIVTPGEAGWTTPEFHGWVTRENERGVLVCEPAKVGGG